MLKNGIFSLVFMSVVSLSNAQDGKASKSKQVENIYTSIKPADGQGVVFNTQEELDQKRDFKKNNIIDQIKENSSDTSRVRFLRMELWRFENAVVKPVNK